MPENSIIRALSVILIMLIVGFTWFPIRLAWLKKKGIEEDIAKKQASKEARVSAILAAFIYMVFMVSLVRLFL